jgi:glyoxylase-like metal-dependent hydrolase (beta-lactamase superfamily II)
VDINGSNLVLKHYGRAHTDGDISVAFTHADILHTGDTYWNGVYPFIDYSTGGHIDGMIRAADVNLAASADTTIIIPGHGYPVSSKSELKEYRDMLVGVRVKRHAQKAGPIAGPDDSGETHCSVRCEMGTVRHRTGLLCQARLRGSLIPGYRWAAPPG